MKYVATVITAAFVYWLFRLDRRKGLSVSPAMWIPVIWFGIICSRPVSVWLNPNRGDVSDRLNESSPIDAACFGILIIAALLVLNWRAPRVRQFLQLNLPVLLYFLYCGLSISWSDDPVIATKRWVKAVGDMLMGFVILTDPDPEHALNRLYARIGFVFLPMSLLFILYFPDLGTMYDASEHVTMYTGVATFKNLLGVLCLAGGLGALWALIGAWQDRENPDRNRRLIANGIAYLFALGLVIRADSMTSFSSLCLTSVVMIAASLAWVRRRPHALVGAFSAAIAAAGFALFLSSGASVLQELGRNPTLTGRTMIWKAVLAQPINPWIGAGFESFWMGDRMQAVWSMSQYGIQQAHDGYLELYLNLGWIGLLLLGLLIVTGYYNAIALYRRNPQAGTMRVGLITAAVLFAFTEAGFRMLSPDWFGLLLAVVAMPIAPAPARTGFALKALRPRPRTEARILQ